MDSFSRRIDRREFLKKAAIAGTTLVGLEVMGCTPAAPPPAPTATKPAAPPTPAGPAATPTPSEAERVAQLVEGARKEGRVMLYTVGRPEGLALEQKALEQKYPFLKLEMYVGTGEAIAEKIRTEARAGKTIADVAVSGFDDIYQFLQAGLLQKYESPQRKVYPKELVDPQGQWTVQHYDVHVMAYNTKLVPPERAPKTYEDLTDPWWNGKLGIETQCWEWFSYQLLIRGRDKGLELMRKLAANKPRLQKGHTSLTKLVEAGEVPAVIMTYQNLVQGSMDQGAPMRWVNVNPTSTSATCVVILKDAPHPNAAKLLVDLKLSEEGQKVIAQQRRTPTRPGVLADPPSLSQGVQFFPPTITIGDEIKKNEKIFAEIFGAL